MHPEKSSLWKNHCRHVLVGCKDSARRVVCVSQKRAFGLRRPEPPPSLSKDSENASKIVCTKRRVLDDFPAVLFLAFRGRNGGSFCPFCDNKLYDFLSRKMLPAAARTLSGARKRVFLRTGILGILTGILGAFPICTFRRRYMYIYEPRKSLIVNNAKERVRTACISSLFTTQR